MYYTSTILEYLPLKNHWYNRIDLNSLHERVKELKGEITKTQGLIE